VFAFVCCLFLYLYLYLFKICLILCSSLIIWLFLWISRCIRNIYDTSIHSLITTQEYTDITKLFFFDGLF
jgi:hypothetical protein